MAPCSAVVAIVVVIPIVVVVPVAIAPLAMPIAATVAVPFAMAAVVIAEADAHAHRGRYVVVSRIPIPRVAPVGIRCPIAVIAIAIVVGPRRARRQQGSAAGQ